MFNKCTVRGLSYWPQIPCGLAKNQRTCVINLHRDSRASMLSDFFQGQLDNGLPNLSGKIGQTRRRSVYLLFTV